MEEIGFPTSMQSQLTKARFKTRIKMKKILITIVALFTLGIFSASAQKIGHLDYYAVMDSSSTYKTAMAKSEELTAGFEEQIIAIQKEYETKAGLLQTEGTGMAPIIRESRERELQELGLVAQGLEAEYQKSAQIVQERYMGPLQEWLKEAVDIVGKSKGLDYVLYYDEQGGLFWVNPDKGVDITNAVITEMLKLEAANPIAVPGG